MRRKLAFLLCLVMALSVGLTTLGGSAEQSDYDRLINTTYTMDWYWVCMGQDYYPDWDMVNEEFNRILHEDYGATGLTVNNIGLDWNDYGVKLNAMLMSGEKVDLLHPASWTVNPEMAIPQGMFVAWDDYMHLVPGFYEMWEPYFKYMTETGPEPLYEKKFWRIPIMKEFASQFGLIFNRTVCEELGILEEMRAVKTPADLEKLMDVYIAAYPPDQYVCANSANTQFMMWRENGKEKNKINWPVMYDADLDDYTMGFESAEWAEYMAQMRRWQEKGYNSPLLNTVQFNDLENYGFFVGYGWVKPGGDVENNFSNAERRGYEVEYMAIGDIIMERAGLIGNSMAVPRTSQNPEASMFVFQLVCMDPVLTNLLNYGIEGYHYTRDNEYMQMERTEEGANYWVDLWYMGNRNLCYRRPGETQDIGPLYQAMNAAAIVLGNDGFIFPGNILWPDGKEYDRSQYDAEMWNIDAQYMNSMATGIMTDAQFEEFKQKCYDSGFGEFLEISKIYYAMYKDCRDSDRLAEWPDAYLKSVGYPVSDIEAE